jgi:hypothetical protein
MSYEQQPLLPSSYAADQTDQTDQSQTSGPSTWRNRFAEALESPTVHKLVITLVRFFISPILIGPRLSSD